jgi:hypothetical protein
MATAAAAGGLPLELSLDTVAAPAAATTAESAVERRRRRDREVQRRRRARVSALYAELGAMLPSLPTSRVSEQLRALDYRPPPSRRPCSCRSVSRRWRHAAPHGGGSNL